AGFRQPPDAAQPWAYWWWVNGNVTEASITRDLEQMKAKGFSGFLMFDSRNYHDDNLPPPPAPMEFMSPQWRELLAFGIQEAARVGLQVSVNLSSCAGALKGPWEVGADAPKRLICQTTALAGGTRFDAALTRPERKHFWDIATFAVKYGGAALAGNAEWVNAGAPFQGFIRARPLLEGLSGNVPPELARNLPQGIEALAWSVTPGDAGKNGLHRFELAITGSSEGVVQVAPWVQRFMAAASSLQGGQAGQAPEILQERNRIGLRCQLTGEQINQALARLSQPGLSGLAHRP
ncbi:MAG: hypothetical protein HGA66_09925, partial [Holophaga sp.]|nr:hypothetical protein [Holophaga sp.]